MIIGYIKGQELQLKSELIVADTIDYLTAKFVFKTADWQGLSKWAHFKKGDTVYDIPLTADSITKSDHLNLAAGEWEVYLHGNTFDGGEVVERITTEVAKLTVKGTGSLNGEPFPEIPASETERINAKLADHEERIAEIEEHGGTTDYNDLNNKPSINGVELNGNKTTEQLGIEIPSLEGYATESYVNNHHDSTKQDVISDLDDIRSGAALGATALQDAPIDGKQYARQDGEWSEVVSSGQGWTDEQIDLLEAVFEKLVYTDAEGGTIAAQLIRSLRGGVIPEEPITITFDGAKAVISGLGNTTITYSGTTAKIGYMPL